MSPPTPTPARVGEPRGGWGWWSGKLSIPTPSQHSSPGTKPPLHLGPVSQIQLPNCSLKKSTRVDSTKELYFQVGEGLGPATHLGSSSAGKVTPPDRQTCADRQQTSTWSRGRGGPESQPPRRPRGRAGFPALRKASKGCSIKLVRVVHCPYPKGRRESTENAAAWKKGTRDGSRRSLTAWALTPGHRGIRDGGPGARSC